MSWKPKYTITHRLIFTMRQIGEAIGAIRAVNLGSKRLAELEIEARAISTHASTSIEGNPLPLTDVKRLLKQDPAHIRDTEREVLNYNNALQAIYGQVRDGSFRLDMTTIEAVQGMVVDGLMRNPGEVGSVRQDVVVIRDPMKLDSVVFMPPDWKDVPRLLQDLVVFVNSQAGVIDPIILAGLFHRQAVLIHPFMDGNGRTARLVAAAILGTGGGDGGQGIDVFELFSFENYYNRNITRYFQEVGLVGDYYDFEREVDFTRWLEYFADGVLDELSRVRKTLGAAPLVWLEEHHRKILDYLDTHGRVTQLAYGEISNRSLASRKKDFQKLIDLGLIEKRGGGRSTYYVRLERV